MTDERLKELNNYDLNAELTDNELSQGWHWCYDFDGLLVGPTTEEANYCTCNEIIRQKKGVMSMSDEIPGATEDDLEPSYMWPGLSKKQAILLMLTGTRMTYNGINNGVTCKADFIEWDDDDDEFYQGDGPGAEKVREWRLHPSFGWRFYHE